MLTQNTEEMEIIAKENKSKSDSLPLRDPELALQNGLEQISNEKLIKWNKEGKYISYENVEYESALFSFLPNCFFKIRTMASRCFTFHPFKCCELSLGVFLLVFFQFASVSTLAILLILNDLENRTNYIGLLTSILLSLSFVSAGKNLAFHLFMGMPWERQVAIHKFLAFMAICVSICHGVLMGLGNENSVSGLVLVSVMGSVMVVFMVLKKCCYWLFYMFHGLVIITIIVFSVLHGAKFVLVGVGAWVLDGFIRFFLILRNNFKTAKTELFVFPGGIIRVELTPKSGKRFRFRGGQYVFICIPRANISEFHPISMSNSPFDSKMVLHFKKVGRWTGKVLSLVESSKSPKPLQTTVFVNGPYGNPRVDIDSPRYQLVLLIAGGMGITPMQSIYNELLIQHIRGRPFIKVKLVWTLRDQNILHSIASHPDCLYNKQDISPSQISSLEKSHLVNLNFSKVMDPNFFLTGEGDLEDISQRYKVQVHLGRPNFSKIMEEMAALAVQNNLHHVAVLSCGPASMTNQAFKTSYENTKNLSTSQGKSFKVNFDFHSEVFEF